LPRRTRSDECPSLENARGESGEDLVIQLDLAWEA